MKPSKIIVDGKPFGPDEIEAAIEGLAKHEQITAARKGRIRDTTVRLKGKAIGIVGGIAAAQLAAMREPRRGK